MAVKSGGDDVLVTVRASITTGGEVANGYTFRWVMAVATAFVGF